MENFEWKDKFSVHVDLMDKHHKKLLGYLTELQNELQEGNVTQKVGETLNALAEYTDFHFAEEERLLRAIDYPELATQLNQHAYFTNEVHEMNKQFKLGTLPTRSVLNFLWDWFVKHVTQEDHKYGEVMKRGNPLI
jgi:hemerythrin